MFFDAASTQLRPALLKQAIEAGKHVYCEKPVATNLDEALDLYKAAQKPRHQARRGAGQAVAARPAEAEEAGDAGFFGRMLSVRGEFGYWVFEGDLQPAQRPSWNYRKQDGGGIILDMLCHWRYVLDNLFGEVQGGVVPRRHAHPVALGRARQEVQGHRRRCRLRDVRARGPQRRRVIAQINSSWTTRVRRDDLVTFQVDGTHGSAVAGLHDCRTQSRVNTPKPVWNPDIQQPINFFEHWQAVPEYTAFDNGFKVQWEAFIRHVVER